MMYMSFFCKSNLNYNFFLENYTDSEYNNLFLFLTHHSSIRQKALVIFCRIFDFLAFVKFCGGF